MAVNINRDEVSIKWDGETFGKEVFGGKESEGELTL